MQTRAHSMETMTARVRADHGCVARTRRAVGLLASLLVLAVPAVADPTIRGRLDRAQQARDEGRARLSPAEQDLLWLLNFEEPDMMLARDGGWIPIALEKRHFSPGKFGRGYYFELPQSNLLPPGMADVETDLSGFVASRNAVLESAVADTRFGTRALAFSGTGVGDGF